MAMSEAQRRANTKYLTEKVEDIKIRVPKGEKDFLKAHAKKMGESLNGFINRAIEEAIANDNRRPERYPATTEPS